MIIYIILYLLISFIILFINYKKQWFKIQESISYHDDITDTSLFWKYLVFIPLFWIIILPLYYFIILLWNLLDKIYNKYFDE